MTQPLYQQIFNDLREQILSKERAIDSQLPTEKELSEQYNVSRITSKRALNELEQEGLIYRVRGKGSFVKQMTVVTRTAKRILFLLPFSNDLSLGNFSEGLTPIMQERQIDVLMTDSDFLTHKSAAEITEEFDGMIYYADSTEARIEVLFELYLKQFPVIILDKKIHDIDFPAVLSDNLAGGRLATEMLIEEGHTRIGYLFGEQNHPQSTRQRYLGYLSRLNEAQLSFQTSLQDTEATIDSLVSYVKCHQLSAIVCENDLVAIQAMRTLRQANLTVPEAISVVGFDNIQAAAFVDPPLTTISQNFKQIGQLAGENLLYWIETGKKPKDHLIPVQLIQRTSTQKNNTN